MSRLISLYEALGFKYTAPLLRLASRIPLSAKKDPRSAYSE